MILNWWQASIIAILGVGSIILMILFMMRSKSQLGDDLDSFKKHTKNLYISTLSFTFLFILSTIVTIDYEISVPISFGIGLLALGTTLQYRRQAMHLSEAIKKKIDAR